MVHFNFLMAHKQTLKICVYNTRWIIICLSLDALILFFIIHWIIRCWCCSKKFLFDGRWSDDFSAPSARATGWSPRWLLFLIGADDTSTVKNKYRKSLNWNLFDKDSRWIRPRLYVMHTFFSTFESERRYRSWFMTHLLTFWFLSTRAVAAGYRNTLNMRFDRLWYTLCTWPQTIIVCHFRQNLNLKWGLAQNAIYSLVKSSTCLSSSCNM